ncbi:MAG: SGNH hydrolase domain-containing protein, partial [Aeromicrobium sp.]
PGTYDAVIATHATSLSIERPKDGRSREQAVVDGLVDAWTTQVPPDTRIIALVDNPQTQETNSQCVERHGATDPDRCATSRRYGFEKFDGSAEAVERVPTASLVDMSDYYCGPAVCPSVIGGVNVYRDRTHLTNTFVLTLAPYLGDAIESALRDQSLL